MKKSIFYRLLLCVIFLANTEFALSAKRSAAEAGLECLEEFAEIAAAARPETPRAQVWAEAQKLRLENNTEELKNFLQGPRLDFFLESEEERQVKGEASFLEALCASSKGKEEMLAMLLENPRLLASWQKSGALARALLQAVYHARSKNFLERLLNATASNLRQRHILARALIIAARPTRTRAAKQALQIILNAYLDLTEDQQVPSILQRTQHTLALDAARVENPDWIEPWLMPSRSLEELEAPFEESCFSPIEWAFVFTVQREATMQERNSPSLYQHLIAALKPGALYTPALLMAMRIAAKEGRVAFCRELIELAHRELARAEFTLWAQAARDLIQRYLEQWPDLAEVLTELETISPEPNLPPLEIPRLVAEFAGMAARQIEAREPLNPANTLLAFTRDEENRLLMPPVRRVRGRTRAEPQGPMQQRHPEAQRVGRIQDLTNSNIRGARFFVL